MIIANKIATGIVIAGGLSSRFNRNELTYIHKALSLFKDMKLIDYIVDQIEPFCKEVFIVVNNIRVKSEFENQITCLNKYSNIEIVIDLEFAGKGPLRGILTGFHYASSEYLFVTACDMIIHTNLVQLLLNYLFDNVECQISTIFYDNDIIEPTIFAINKKDSLFLLNILINTGRCRVTDLIRCLNNIAFFKLGKIIPNINFKEDLLKLYTGINDQDELQILKIANFSNPLSINFANSLYKYQNGDLAEYKDLLKQELYMWENTPFKQLLLHTLQDLQNLLTDADIDILEIK